MPELPEVESVVRTLNRQLPGRTIRSVEIHRSRTVRPDSPAGVIQQLTGARFESVRRRGKYLVFHLRRPAGNERFLVVAHLGMTGRMQVARESAPRPKHSVVTLELDSGRFDFSDPRIFGRFSLDPTALKELGPEPLSRNFTPALLGDAMAGSRSAVKVCLMDQSRIAGLGNIYASEALFRAGTPPDRPAGLLKPAEIKRLHQAIRQTLREAIHASFRRGKSRASDGTTTEFYYGEGGGSAGNESRFQVYDRAGLPCPVCGTPIRRTVQAGRSTYFCPACQPSRPITVASPT